MWTDSWLFLFLEVNLWLYTARSVVLKLTPWQSVGINVDPIVKLKVKVKRNWNRLRYLSKETLQDIGYPF